MEKEINNSFYDSYGERWYSAYDDPVALLRAENSVKFPWILERIKGAGLEGAIVRECSRVLKPGGLFFFHTFNRNALSGLVVIKPVEVLIKNTPKNMHLLRLFITPEELREYNEEAGLKVIETTGIRPVFSSFLSKDLLQRKVPARVRFKTTTSTLFSYLGVAIKNVI